jgi:hypothetical protein
MLLCNNISMSSANVPRIIPEWTTVGVESQREAFREKRALVKKY